MDELESHQDALEAFQALGEDHRADLVDWIEKTDDPLRRSHRIRMVVEVLLHGSVMSPSSAAGLGPTFPTAAMSALSLLFV